MPLTLANKSLGKKAESEALDIISGSDDNKLIKAGETFAGTIVAFVVNSTGTVANVIAQDTDSTDIIAGGETDEGFLNIDGVDLAVGAFFQAGKYDKGSNYSSITTGTASVIAYYKYDIDRS
jgi:hypothetical protein